MIDCKLSKNKRRPHIGLQVYQLKIIEFKIDCIFWKKPRWRPLYKWCPYNISTLTVILDVMLDVLFFYPKPLNKIILENRLHKFKLHTSSSK